MKYFQVITAFGHSAFITSQLLFVPIYKHADVKILSLSNIQQMSAIQQFKLFMQTHIYL